MSLYDSVRQVAHQQGRRFSYIARTCTLWVPEFRGSLEDARAYLGEHPPLPIPTTSPQLAGLLCQPQLAAVMPARPSARPAV